MALKISDMGNRLNIGLGRLARLLLAVVGLLGVAVPAYAHHPTGGAISTTFWEGFLSGLGHPVIGFDHLIFVISVGLLASTVARGYWIPVAFVLTALVGTGLHVMLVSLPLVEVLIAASVLVFGLLLAKLEKPSTAIMAVLAGVAGLFHGYAYGEAIIGATAVPLAAYLIGFTFIQAIIALTAYRVAALVRGSGVERPDFLRFAGCITMGSGMAFMAASF